MLFSIATFAITPIMGTLTVCVGGTTTLTDATPGGTWSSGATGVAIVGSSSGIVSGVASGTAIITYNTSGGFVIATVTVNPLPTICTVTGGGTYCPGGPCPHVGLTCSSSGVNYQLFRGVTPVGSPMAGTGVAIDFGMLCTAGTYTVIATNSFGCTVNMAGSATVIIGSLPTSCTVTGGGSYCAGTPCPHVGLSCSSTGISYQLFNGASPVGTPVFGSGATLDFGAQCSSGTYTVVATNAISGCTTNMSDSVTITINPPPASIAGTTLVCVGGTVTLTDAGAGTWSSSSVTTATVGSSTGIVTGVSVGTADITYTLPSGCYTTVMITVDPCSTTGIAGNRTKENNVTLFPNPATDEVSITTVAGAFSSYTITNEAGQVMLQAEISAIKTSVNIKALPAGMYFINLKGDSGSVVKKFVKE